jgi:hypothetical protein
MVLKDGLLTLSADGAAHADCFEMGELVVCGGDERGELAHRLAALFYDRPSWKAAFTAARASFTS